MAANIQVTLKIDGIQKVLGHLRWTPEDDLAIALGLLKSGRRMLNLADPNVPVQTGNLRSTGKIQGPVRTQFGRAQEVRVEYGGDVSKEHGGFPAPQRLAALGGRVTYAAYQHRNNPRLPRWLENAFQAESPNTARRVADELRARLGRKVTGA